MMCNRSLHFYFSLLKDDNVQDVLSNSIFPAGANQHHHYVFLDHVYLMAQGEIPH